MVASGRVSKEIDPEAKGALIARLVWRDGGNGELMTTLDDEGTVALHPFGRGQITIARGRWVSIEQEVILNAPGQRDGILRLWIDGELKVDRRNVQMRETADQRLTGISADLVYGNREPASGARTATKARLTPFELRWR